MAAAIAVNLCLCPHSLKLVMPHLAWIKLNDTEQRGAEIRVTSSRLEESLKRIKIPTKHLLKCNKITSKPTSYADID